MQPKYKAIIYDWDGCLLNSLPAWIEAYKYVLSQENIKITDRKVTKYLGDWDALSSLGHPDPKKAKDTFIQKLNETIVHAKLFPKVTEVLEEVKQQRVQLFLATSSLKETFFSNQKAVTTKALFEYCVFADDVSRYKPNPQAINVILNEFGVSKDEVVMVGDSDKDILAAKNAGIDSVLFAPAENQHVHNFDYLRSLEPTWEVSEHEQVIDLLANCKHTPQALQHH